MIINLLTSRRGKVCGAVKIYWVCNAGKDERGVECDNNTSNLRKQTQSRLDVKLITIMTIMIFYRLT